MQGVRLLQIRLPAHEQRKACPSWSCSHLSPFLRLFSPLGTSMNAAAGWSEACMPCKAQRWERRLGGLLEGDGGGMKGWLQSQNHAAGCGGQDGARCGLVERRSWGAAPPPSSQRATLLSPNPVCQDRVFQ